MHSTRVFMAWYVLALITAAACASETRVEAGDSKIVIGYKTCGSIRGYLEDMLSAAKSQCQPGKDDEKIAIIIASDLPAFRSDAAKRAWFILIVGVVGREARNAGLGNFSTLYVTDSESARSLNAYAMPIARASELQQQIHSDNITAEAYTSAVMSEMRPTRLPAKLLGRSQ